MGDLLLAVARASSHTYRIDSILVCSLLGHGQRGVAKELRLPDVICGNGEKPINKRQRGAGGGGQIKFEH